MVVVMGECECERSAGGCVGGIGGRWRGGGLRASELGRLLGWCSLWSTGERGTLFWSPLFVHFDEVRLRDGRELFKLEQEVRRCIFPKSWREPTKQPEQVHTTVGQRCM